MSQATPTPDWGAAGGVATLHSVRTVVDFGWEDWRAGVAVT